MTEAQANKILRTKYPEATIYRRNSMGGTSSCNLAVTFKKEGKVYDYHASSYQQVLAKLGINILYSHDVANMQLRINKLSGLIEKGWEVNLFCKDHKKVFSSEEIAHMKAEIDSLQTELATAIIV